MMLGFAIRIKDGRNDTFYKNRFNLLNNFIVGELLQDARLFLDKETAQKKLDCLNHFLESPFQTGTIYDFIRNNTSEFDGFELVEVEFDEVYYILIMECQPNKRTYIKSVDYDVHGAGSVRLATDSIDCQRYYAWSDANTEIRTLELQSFPMAEHIKVKPVFVNPKLFT